MHLIEPSSPNICGCEASGVFGDLMSVDDALALVERVVVTVSGTEILPLAQVRGRVLAKAVRAESPVPPFDNAAMDGYALDAAALVGTGPWRLRVDGCIPAGKVGRAPPAGSATRIFTGAPVPPGTSAVIAQEEVCREERCILLTRRPKPGENIRREGSDTAAGTRVLMPGDRLGSAEIAAAASMGRKELVLRRRVRVAVLVTGDELRAAGDPLSPATIYDVNGPMLAALLERADVELVASESVGDGLDVIVRTLDGLSREADLVVTTGGVSVGGADTLRPAITRLGGQVHFAGVAMKPGKPMALGALGSALWLGLPGNPLAALTGWVLFGCPVLDRLSDAHAIPPRRHVVAERLLSHSPGRSEFRPARLVGIDGDGREVISVPSITHSHRLSDIANFDGFAHLPAATETIPPGSLIEFLPFRR
jgi:molybdopterin molybdotransferase